MLNRRLNAGTGRLTGVIQSTQTTDSGDFTAPYLTPGTYKVTIQSSGFQKSVVDNVGLAVDQRARVLKPGTGSETVVVQANAIALDTDSAAISQLVNSEQVDQLSLNGRNFLQLLGPPTKPVSPPTPPYSWGGPNSSRY